MAFFFFSGEPGDVLYPNLNTIRIIVQIPSTKRCQIQILNCKIPGWEKRSQTISVHLQPMFEIQFCLETWVLWKNSQKQNLLVYQPETQFSKTNLLVHQTQNPLSNTFSILWPPFPGNFPTCLSIPPVQALTFSLPVSALHAMKLARRRNFPISASL
jgi:hypothetical protein